MHLSNYQFKSTHVLEPSINRLVTGGNTKLCCFCFVLALVQNTTANKIDLERTQDYEKLFPVCKIEILQVMVNEIEVLSSLRVISDDIRLKVPKIAKKGTLVPC